MIGVGEATVNRCNQQWRQIHASKQPQIDVQINNRQIISVNKTAYTLIQPCHQCICMLMYIAKEKTTFPAAHTGVSQ